MDPNEQTEEFRPETEAPEGQQFAGALLDDPPQEQETADERQRNDWKAQAEYERGYREALERQLSERRQVPAQGEAQAPRSVQLRQEIAQLEANPPKGDPLESADAFRAHQEYDRKLQRLHIQRVDAENAEERQRWMEQQSAGVLENFKRQAANGATAEIWRQIEPQFDEAVRLLNPGSRNQQTFETIKRNLEYPHLMQRAAGAGRRAAPPPPPSGAYNAQGQPQRQSGKMEWKSEADKRVSGDIYGMTPEQAYRDRPTVDGDRYQIYNPQQDNDWRA